MKVPRQAHACHCAFGDCRRLVWALVMILLSTSALAQESKPEAKATDAATRQYATAAALQNREQYDLASEEWTKFLAKYPQDERVDKATHYLGLCHLQTKQYAPAAALFAKVISGYPKSTLLEPSYLYLGLAQYNQARAGQAEMFSQAATTFGTLLDKFPRGKHVAQATFYRGESLYALGKKAEAAQQYERLVKQFPQDPQVPDALYALGVAQDDLGQAAAAEATYAALIKRFPQHALVGEVTLRRGEALFAQKKYAEAEKLFAAAAARPGFTLADQALARQAAAAAERQQYAEAATLYAALIAKFPESKLASAARLGAGRCQFLAGKPADARATLAPIMAAGGEAGAEAGHWIARSWLKEARPQDALPAADQAIGYAGKGAWAVALQFDRADALAEMPDRVGEAVTLYAAIAKEHSSDPLAPQALYLAAFTALRQKQFEPAQAYANDFLQRFAQDALRPDVLFVLAESELQTAKYGAAAGRFAELLKAFPQHRDAEQWKVRRGMALYLDKKYADAVAALQPVASSLASKPLKAEAYYLIGSSQNEQRQFGPAAKSLEAALASDATFKQADEAQLALAHALEQSGNAAAARARLEKFAQSSPTSSAQDRAHFRLGELAYAANDWPTAAREYQLVAEKWPQSPLAPQAVYGLAWTELGQKDYAAASRTLDGLIDNPAAKEIAAKARYARAFARQQLKQFAGACEDLQAFLQSAPPPAEKSEARYLLAVCQASDAKPAEAEATLRSLLSDDPGYAGADKALYELGWSLDAQNKKTDAAATFARLARDKPDSPYAPESLYYVGETEYGQQRYAQAATAYYDAMHKAGRTELGEKAAHKLGWAYYREGAWDKARKSFEYQRNNYPQGTLAADGAFMLAECLFKDGKFNEALDAYAQVKNPTGKDFAVLALLHAGQSASQLQQWDRSLERLTRAAKEFPQSEYLPEILYEQGWAQQNRGKLDEAMALYEAVTEKTDAEIAARARFMIGEVCFEKKDHAAAVRHFFKAAVGYGYPQWQAAAQFEAGRCFEILKKPDQAKKSYQEIVDKFPQSDQAEPARKRLATLGK